jgi:hypothetical protein
VYVRATLQRKSVLFFAQVFPLSMGDRLDTFGVFGIEAEVWLQPGKPATQV